MPTTAVLHIRNMVCPRCVSSVRETLRGLGLAVRAVRLGEADLAHPPSEAELRRIETALRAGGFELLRDPGEQMVERVKLALLEYRGLLEGEKEPRPLKAHLEETLGRPSRGVGAAFAEREGVTIARYLILLKIERVKELLGYGELTLSEIAFRLRYSSVQHLSNQFRRVTGVSVREYKGGGAGHRHPLDALKGTL